MKPTRYITYVISATLLPAGQPALTLHYTDKKRARAHMRTLKKEYPHAAITLSQHTLAVRVLKKHHFNTIKTENATSSPYLDAVANVRKQVHEDIE